MGIIKPVILMKRILIPGLSILSLLIGMPQSQAQESVSLGPKAGISSTTLVGEGVDEASPRVNFVGGLFYSINATEMFSIQPELLYHRKGATFENQAFNLKTDLTIDYLELPILFKIRVPLGDVLYPSIYAGPYGAVKLRDKSVTTQLDTDISIQEDPEVHSFDGGIVIGVGLDLEAGAFYFGGDIRYGIGLSTIDRSVEDPIKAYNRSLSILFGLGVNIDR